MKCKKHPNYKAKMYPTSNCKVCKAIWMEKINKAVERDELALVAMVKKELGKDVTRGDIQHLPILRCLHSSKITKKTIKLVISLPKLKTFIDKIVKLKKSNKRVWREDGNILWERNG